MKEFVQKVIKEDSELSGYQFHELSVPVLKNIVERAVDLLLSSNEVLCRRTNHHFGENALVRKAETVWLRQLLLHWFTKQFTNRRTERLKSKRRSIKSDACSKCGGNMQCLSCDIPSIGPVELVPGPCAGED